MKALWFAAVGLGISGGWLARSRDSVITAYGRVVIVCALIFALIASTGCAPTIAAAGPLLDGATTAYAINQSGPKAQAVEGNPVLRKLFGPDVTAGEVMTFKAVQAALWGGIVHAAGKTHPGRAKAVAWTTFAIHAFVSALNVRNAGIVRRANR